MKKILRTLPRRLLSLMLALVVAFSLLPVQVSAEPEQTAEASVETPAVQESPEAEQAAPEAILTEAEPEPAAPEAIPAISEPEPAISAPAPVAEDSPALTPPETEPPAALPAEAEALPANLSVETEALPASLPAAAAAETGTRSAYAFTVYPETGFTIPIQGTYTVNWETNFTPVKLYLKHVQYAASIVNPNDQRLMETVKTCDIIRNENLYADSYLEL